VIKREDDGEEAKKTTAAAAAAHSRRALFGEVEEAGGEQRQDGDGKQSFGLLVAEFIGVRAAHIVTRLLVHTDARLQEEARDPQPTIFQGTWGELWLFSIPCVSTMFAFTITNFTMC
jgi:hypothetical protein